MGLEPYTGPWTRRHARHLVSRSNFGALKRDVDNAYNDGSASAAATLIVDEAASIPLPEPPQWYNGNGSTGVSEIYDIQTGWLEAMRTLGFIEKMTLFWHNHLPTGWPAVDGKTSYSIGHLTYEYYKFLRLNALGNVQDMIRGIGKNAAMHYYLDGYLNEAGAANENFARELLELFTMSQYNAVGAENYSENDIKEIAKALTGWTVNSNRVVVFNSNRYDGSVKSFWGQSGNFGYDDVIDIVFAQRGAQSAHYICRKLYTFFVHAVPDEAIVAELASDLVAQGFEILPVVKKLLSSEHFYRDDFIGARIKSPIEYIIGFLREAEVNPTAEMLDRVRDAITPANLGQEALNPPNVAGWPGVNPPDASGNPGHHTWLTTSSLPERWQVLNDIVYDRFGAEYDPIDLAFKISDPSDPFSIAIDVAETIMPLALDEIGIREVEEPFGGNPDIPVPDQVLNGEPHVRNLSKILLDGSPFYEWPFIEDEESAGIDDARKFVRAFIAYLVQLPAYQLT